MARPDGRIEAGQPLRGAISARAWNRALDAADVVLGAGTGIEAGVGQAGSRCLTMPMQVNSTPGIVSGHTGEFSPGSVVVFEHRRQATARVTTGTLGQSLALPHQGYFEMPSAVAYIHTPTAGVSPMNTPPFTRPWGVTADGGKFGSVVSVIISGVAPVRVRSLTYGGGLAHFYATPTIRRSSAESIVLLTGVLESTDCACQNAAKILYIDGNTQASNGGAEVAAMYWALVIL